jgi:hypothetical protein
VKSKAYQRYSGDARHEAAQTRVVAGALLTLLGVACVVPLLVTPVVLAATLEGRIAGPERFIGHLWSQARPNLDYQYGCDTGWHSFSFREGGYFVYDGKVTGSWWIDHLGNIGVRTTAGERLLLFYDMHQELRQLERSAIAPDSVFGTEFRTYKQCNT